MKILLVDDSKVSVRHLGRLFGPYGECTTADDGRTGFEQFLLAHKNNTPFNIITMDINMPDWNGDQAIEAIRTYELAFKKDTAKIIVLSAYLNPKLVMKLFKAGCSYCLNKPLEDEELKKVFDDALKHDAANSLEEMVRNNRNLLPEE